MAEVEKRLENLEREEVKEAGEEFVITCIEQGESFNERGERVPVHPEPIGFDEGCWRPTKKGRMKVRWAVYREADGSERHLLRDCDREQQGLPPLADHGIVRDPEVTGD